MESEPPVAPVAELQYESDRRVRVADLLVLVAKWCIVVGAIVVANFVFQLASYYLVRRALRISVFGMDSAGTVMIGLELLRFAASVWLIVCAIGALCGRLRLARLFSMALVALLVAAILADATTMYFMWSRFGAAGQWREIVSLVLRLPQDCAPAALVLSLVMSRDVKAAISEPN